MRAPRAIITGLTAATLLVAGCSGSESTGATAESTSAEADNTAVDATAGVRTVSVEEGAAIHASPPESLVILDVRTADEFAAGHLDGAIVVDFYADDFTAQLEELDPSVPYLLYCQSGNRSGQAAAIMEDLGYLDVANIDGGILAWTDAGLDVVQ